MPCIKQPKISVITVCFNESKENITLTFDSVSSQSYENTEWIVIDGGSKPETIEAINSYLGKIDKFISEPDKGVYDAMNKGLSIASGDFFIFMNVGDTFHSNSTLEKVSLAINANPGYDCYFGDLVKVDVKLKTREFHRQLKKPSKLLLYSIPICHQTTFSSRLLYDVVGPFDLRYPVMADWHWLHRSLVQGAKWKHIDVTVCDYLRGGISDNTQALRKDYQAILAEVYDSWERVSYPIIWKFIRYFNRFDNR